MNEVKDQVRSYIDDNFIMGSDSAQFSDADSLLDLHIVDSTGILELILFLEECFGIHVEDAEMVPENLDSLDAIAAYIGRKRQAQLAA